MQYYLFTSWPAVSFQDRHLSTDLMLDIIHLWFMLSMKRRVTSNLECPAKNATTDSSLPSNMFRVNLSLHLTSWPCTAPNFCSSSPYEPVLVYRHSSAPCLHKGTGHGRLYKSVGSTVRLVRFRSFSVGTGRASVTWPARQAHVLFGR